MRSNWRQITLIQLLLLIDQRRKRRKNLRATHSSKNGWGNDWTNTWFLSAVSKIFFYYFVCRSELMFDTKGNNNSFAYSLHENNSFCRIKEQYYNVIAALYQVTEAFKKNSSKPYSIPCLYTCFRLLLHKTQSVNITFHAEIFEKMQQAVIYNHQNQLDLYSSKRRLPKIFELETVKENVHVQTFKLMFYQLVFWTNF